MMTQRVNPENMRATYQFGPRSLCDGYVIASPLKWVKALIMNSFLCDGHVIIRQLPFISPYLINVPTYE
jgi:hypothetical protein